MNYYSTLRYAALVAGLLFVMTRDAEAYIDPGTTSYLFQIVIAGLTAVVFFFAGLRRRVADFFKAMFGKKDSDPGAEPDSGKPAPPEK